MARIFISASLSPCSAFVDFFALGAMLAIKERLQPISNARQDNENNQTIISSGHQQIKKIGDRFEKNISANCLP
eukprot:5871541-Amphidinium_carterae.1